MRRMVYRISCLLVLLPCLAVPGIEAQERSSLAASGADKELLLAFLGVEEEDLLIGSMPEGAERLILRPPNGNLVGSLRYDKSLSVIFESDLERKEAAAWIGRAYAAEEWVAIDYGRFQGGFNPSPVELPTQFCREGEMVMVTVQEYRQGSRLTYHHSADRRMGASCEAMQQRTSPMRGFEFPQLVAPEGSDQQGATHCAGSNESAIGTGLLTELSALEVMDHYSSQLAEVGWLPVASCWDGPVAVQVWQIEGGDEPAGGMLVVNKRANLTSVLLSAAQEDER